MLCSILKEGAEADWLTVTFNKDNGHDRKDVMTKNLCEAQRKKAGWRMRTIEEEKKDSPAALR